MTMEMEAKMCWHEISFWGELIKELEIQNVRWNIYKWILQYAIARRIMSFSSGGSTLGCVRLLLLLDINIKV